MTSTLSPTHNKKRLLIPAAPVLVVDGHRLFLLPPKGAGAYVCDDEARRATAEAMPLVCHAASIAARLRIPRLHAYDVLELFAFVHPGKFTSPTPRGLARALHLLEPASVQEQCTALRDAARHMLADLAAAEGREEKSDPAALAAMMGLYDPANDGTDLGWPWSPAVLAALGRTDTMPERSEINAALRPWNRLPEWARHAPPSSSHPHDITEEEIAERLRRMLLSSQREDRPQQRAYATAIGKIFAPSLEGETHVSAAEAGTGTGKTLGYLAPATVWAEKNASPVWVSTYTRNLQRQADAELDRFYSDPSLKTRKAVTRKGRENYLCLLNLEDATQAPAMRTNDQGATALGLMIRWAAATADGDMGGRDFPGWLPGLMGQGRIAAFADRRGECIYSACPHFDRCFIEKSMRNAKRADIVIANHALVMSQVIGDADNDTLPTRIIFDEGHHIFEAADGAFSVQLNGAETADMRRWLLGTEGGRKSRARGLRRRLEDLIAQDEKAIQDMEALLEAARALPGPGWRERLRDKAPRGVAESFLHLCRTQVLARNTDDDGIYSIETAPVPPTPELFDAARTLLTRLKDVQRPMLALAEMLLRFSSNEGDDPEMLERARFLASSLKRRAKDTVGAWIAMLETMASSSPEKTPHAFADWLEITRIDGVERDCGFHRHHIDPASLFAQRLKPHVQGVAVTSATLRDISSEDSEGWRMAQLRAGIAQLTEGVNGADFFTTPSPFDHVRQTRVIVVTDVNKSSAQDVAKAYAALFEASGGGALGLFTAVRRLKETHRLILPLMTARGIPLHAQHADPLDTATLIDIFKEEEDACLLGTDATRDGVDVPGRALRLVVYDRVPWSRPTILHKARREYFGKGYDDMLTRTKLKQAYGRLVRKSDDRGVFVMLDKALPSRLLTAFPEGIDITRAGLEEAITLVKQHR